MEATAERIPEVNKVSGMLGHRAKFYSFFPIMDIVQELDSHPHREKQLLIWHFRYDATHIACLRGQWQYICKNPPPKYEVPT